MLVRPGARRTTHFTLVGLEPDLPTCMQVNWRKDDPSEGYQQLYGPRLGFMLNDSSLNITEGYGQCQALETNFNDVAPMINQV